MSLVAELSARSQIGFILQWSVDDVKYNLVWIKNLWSLSPSVLFFPKHNRTGNLKVCMSLSLYELRLAFINSNEVFIAIQNIELFRKISFMSLMHC